MGQFYFSQFYFGQVATTADADFGQTDFCPNWCFDPEGWGPEGWGPEGCPPPRVRGSGLKHVFWPKLAQVGVAKVGQAHNWPKSVNELAEVGRKNLEVRCNGVRRRGVLCAALANLGETNFGQNQVWPNHWQVWPTTRVFQCFELISDVSDVFN